MLRHTPLNVAFAGVFLVGLVLVGAYIRQVQRTPFENPYTPYKDAIYDVEGERVQFVDGSYQKSAAPGSAAFSTYRFFGNEAAGDLNSDGVPDIAFLITKNDGGSGTFYYVVAALQTSSGYQGSNAVLLGDRIAPQTTRIENGTLIVNFADRAANEPMTSSPHIGVSAYFAVEGGTLLRLNAHE